MRNGGRNRHTGSAGRVFVPSPPARESPLALWGPPHGILVGRNVPMPLSDRSATIANLKAVAASFTAERDWDQFHDAKDLAIGIVIEPADLLQHFRFKSDTQIQKLFESPKRTELEDEIADVLFLLLRLSTRLDCDLPGSLERKLAKNSGHYPVKRARGQEHQVRRTLVRWVLKYENIDFAVVGQL